MREAIVACNVAGTVASAASAADTYVPGFPCRTSRSARSRTISSAKNGVPAALSAIVRPSSPTEGSGPSSSETSVVVSGVAERREGQGLRSRHLRQGAAILGPVGDQREQGRLGNHGEEVGEHRFAGLVDPMRIFDDVDRRGRSGQRRGIHQGGQPSPACIRIDARWLSLGIGDAEQILVQRDVLGIGVRKASASISARAAVGSIPSTPVAERISRAMTWNGTWVVCDSQNVANTSTPRRFAIAATSRVRRLFPIPGGPTTPTTEPWPSIALSNRPSTADISHRRPTRLDSARAALAMPAVRRQAGGAQGPVRRRP